MANAGRILIMPKGAWNESTAYEMLDMVSHDGATWVAKKPSVGVTPSAYTPDYWFNMVGVGSDDLESFKSEVLDSTRELISNSEINTNNKINGINDEIDGVRDSLAGYVPLGGGNMTGALKAVNPEAGVEGVRNIIAGTEDLVAGASALATGAIYIVYE